MIEASHADGTHILQVGYTKLQACILTMPPARGSAAAYCNLTAFAISKGIMSSCSCDVIRRSTQANNSVTFRGEKFTLVVDMQAASMRTRAVVSSANGQLEMLHGARRKPCLAAAHNTGSAGTYAPDLVSTPGKALTAEDNYAHLRSNMGECTRRYDLCIMSCCC